VGDGGLAILHVQGRGFEEDVGLGGGEPGVDVWRRSIRFASRGRECPPDTSFFATYFDAVGIGDPTEASGGDAGDAVGDAVAIAQLVGAVFQETD
jgi:hypothetical protein